LALDEAQGSIALSAISGGMFEIGDDLPTLAADLARLAQVENKDLLQIMFLGRAAIPLDLMTYNAQDLQPSVFFLREDRRVGVLTVFNWTETPCSHSFKISDLNFQIGHQVQAFDVFGHNAPVGIAEGSIEFRNQPPHSVRMIKFVDNSIPAAPPAVSTLVPTSAATGEEMKRSAEVSAESVPALGFRWDFGDGMAAEGEHVRHTYTLPGMFRVHLRADGVDGLQAVKESVIKVTGPLKTRFSLQQNRRYAEHVGP
ncbi:MAG: melibiase, partial [Acidobacteria bacterium]